MWYDNDVLRINILIKLAELISLVIKRYCKFAGTVYPLMEVFHDTAAECHLPYGITQCYLLPDTSEHTPP